MREIKFRLYDKTEKIMKHLDSIWNMPDPNYDFDDIQQYTGLKDKNGKNIYEGDIIKYVGKNMQVIYNCEAFGLVRKNSTIKYFVNMISVDKFEIIGNIYENLNLIEE